MEQFNAYFQSGIHTIFEMKLLLLFIIGFITLIGALDKFVPNFFPGYLRQLNVQIKENSDTRLLKLILNFLKLFSILAWKLSASLFKLGTSLFIFIFIVVKKISLPFMEKTANTLEKTAHKVDQFSDKMDRMSSGIGEKAYKMNDDIDKRNAKNN